jgi:hypothetical protein
MSEAIDQSNLIELSGSFTDQINFKMIIFLFFIGIIIFSDLFVDEFVGKFKDSVVGNATTTKGTLIQISIYTLGFVIMDLLIKGGIV